MRIPYRIISSFTIGLVMFISLAHSSLGQTNDLKISLVLGEDRVPEHLPVAFEAIIKNEGSSDVELYPYDSHLLPSLVLKIGFQSPLALPPAIPGVNDFGFPETRVPSFGSVSIKGYLQNYLRHLTPGVYNVPYSLSWQYGLTGAPGAKSNKLVEAKGKLQFTVSNADPAALERYLSTRIAVLKESTDIGKVRTVAEEISLVDDPAALPALMILKDSGYELEAMNAAEKLPDSEALKLLTAIAGSSKNPAIVKEAIDRIERRRKDPPDGTVRALLDSNNKWLQLEGLAYVERTAHRQFLVEVSALLQSTDADVKAAAERAINKLESASPK